MLELKDSYGIYDKDNAAVKNLQTELQKRGLQMRPFDPSTQIPDTPLLVCITESFKRTRELYNAYTNAMAQHVQGGRGKILTCLLEQGVEIPPLLLSRGPIDLSTSEITMNPEVERLANALKGIRPGPPALGQLRLPNR